MDKKKVPEIRFEGFSGEWEERKVENVAVINPSSVMPDVFEYVDLESVIDTKIINHRSETQKTAPSRAQRVARHGDVFFQTVRPYQKNNCIYYGENDAYVFSTGYAQMRPKEDGVFLLAALQNDSFVKKVLECCTGTGYPAINANILADMALLYPPTLPEQQTIGAYFERLDSLIVDAETRHEKLLAVKKSLLQKMFPQEGESVPRIRFEGFSGEWEYIPLKNIAQKVVEKNTERAYTETFTNSAEVGIISQRNYFDHDIANTENMNTYYIVSNDDFIYNPRISKDAPVGPIKRNKLGRTGIMSPLYTVFRTHDVDNTFLEWYFNSSCWHSYMYFNGDNGARYDRFSIKNDVFFDMLIPYPEEDEQKAIGAYFDNIDKLIENQEQRLEKLKQMKSALLQKMFV